MPGPIQLNLLDRLAHQLTRTTDPSTSYAAGATQVPILRDKQLKVLRVLQTFGPMHDEALAAICANKFGWPLGKSTARTRRNELERAGLVERTGEKVLLATGCRALVWRAVGPS